jgi:hypothetical protein
LNGLMMASIFFMGRSLCVSDTNNEVGGVNSNVEKNAAHLSHDKGDKAQRVAN